ncbi:hypothetical protein SKAU_G00412080 [Synaphobranchus kaupii]|uniref:ribonuclease H n=1 Tax=Synaphobranchus kaupii TaxID=118154 RepID=A0A9Q1E7Y4_SYNKA|nr:hypothetical protein SKAU_G00412080 [Synaphobranchus kaupii]
MLIGLTNSPTTCERLMERALKGIPAASCVVYLDNILVHAPSFTAALANLRQVLGRISNANLHVNPAKCKLLKRERPASWATLWGGMGLPLIRSGSSSTGAGAGGTLESYCHRCNACMAKMGPAGQFRAPLHTSGSGAPMERVTVDILGPFPVTEGGNCYELVAMDYFTKWPEAYAIPSQEAAAVVECLVSGMFARFRVPEELHSD